MWDQINADSERVKFLAWLFLATLLASHGVAIFMVGLKLQNGVFLLAIFSAFFIVAQAARIKIWLGTISAGVIFGLLPIAQTATSAGRFSLLAWKAIMHTALGTSLALFLIAEIPFNGDWELALGFDAALMILALVSMTYIEVETRWYPTIVRVIAGIIIAIILFEVGLGIAYPELTKPARWWKFLGFAKDHWIILTLLIGIPLLLWKKVSVPTIPIGKLLGLGLLGLVISMAFQGPRDWLLDKANRPEVSTAFTGTETTRSVQATSLEPFKVCELEANTSYTFVKVTTSEKDTYRTLYPPDGSTEIHPITGGFYSTPEELPYQDANYAGGILINGLPPGRIITTDKDGCTLGSFNRKSGSIRTLVNNPWIGIVFRK